MRKQKLEVLKEWLIEYMPQTPMEQRSSNFIPKKAREALLKRKVATIEEKTKEKITWRNTLIEKLKISDEDITLVTNSIYKIIEQTLAKGESVIIKNFGIFKIILNEESNQVRFTADEQWLRSINEPLYENELGFKHAYVYKRLQKRTL